MGEVKMEQIPVPIMYVWYLFHVDKHLSSGWWSYHMMLVSATGCDTSTNNVRQGLR